MTFTSFDITPSLLFFIVCVCMCGLCDYMHIYWCVGSCGGQRFMLYVFLHQYPPYILKQSLATI